MGYGMQDIRPPLESQGLKVSDQAVRTESSVGILKVFLTFSKGAFV